MQSISTAWLYPLILIAGALQACGPPMNGVLVILNWRHGGDWSDVQHSPGRGTTYTIRSRTLPTISVEVAPLDLPCS